MNDNIEFRYLTDSQIDTSVDSATSTPKFRGYAAIYNSLSHDLGGFKEVIRPGAFRNAIDSGKEIYACVDHDKSKMLGLLSNGSLALKEDERGLYFESNIPDTSYARDAQAQLRAGFFKGASFGFYPKSSKGTFRREGGNVIHELTDIDCFDVSVVFTPAYPATSVSMRSYEDWIFAEKERAYARDRAIRLAEKMW